MTNPWLKKNPYMSLWLSGANAVAGAARGHASKAAHQQAAMATRQLTEAVFEAWLSAFVPPTTRPGRRKRR
jgi:hypothetical protein